MNAPVAGLGPIAIPQEFQNCFDRQRAAYLAAPEPAYEERVADLKALKRLLKENRDEIVAAINADYGNRSEFETLFTEYFVALETISDAIKHLKKWMKPQRRRVDFMTYPLAKNRVIPQPLGLVGVIVPWNFPLNLSFCPLAAIIAAGNRAMVKMSENSRHLARLLIEKIPAYFPPEKLQFFDEVGGVGVAFSKLPFDHLLFTGSGQTGRAVMAAAAQNLCPVTLELGGKAPAILCDDFPLRKAAERILFVKYLNAGQICTSVDHLWMPQAKIAQFVQEAQRIVPHRYPSLDSPDYTSIIDQTAFDRLIGALDEARARGAQVIQLVPGPDHDAATRKIAPCIVLDAPPDSILWKREIFGPILPIRGFQVLDEVVAAVNAGPRPLAIYPFSNDPQVVQMLLERVMSGGVSVNDGLFHVGQHDLPFGGVGDSGMGHYHGKEGFLTFSKLRPVFYQARFSSLKFMMPPYGRFASKMLAFLIK